MLDPLSVSIPLPSGRPTIIQPARRIFQRIESTNSFILELDNTARDYFTTCPRSAENYLIHSRQSSRTATALSFGGLFHKCEELRLRHGLSPETVAAQHALVHEHFILNPVPPDEYRNEARMIEVLKLYNEFYHHDQWPRQVIRDSLGEPFVERGFKLELCSFDINHDIPYPPRLLIAGEENNPDPAFHIDSLHVYATGIIDVAIEEARYVFNVDHKTSKEGGESWANAFANSAQTVGYVWGLQKILQRQVHGIIMNGVIVREPAKTARATTPRTEFRRVTHFYRPDMVEEWERNTKAITEDFVNCLTRGYFPQVPRSFLSPCSYCQYRENCLLPPEQRLGDLASDLFQNVTWNPLTER